MNNKKLSTEAYLSQYGVIGFSIEIQIANGEPDLSTDQFLEEHGIDEHAVEIKGSSEQITQQQASSVLGIGTITLSPDDHRKNLRAQASRTLAMGFWVLLALVAVAHLGTTIIFSKELFRKTEKNYAQSEIERIEKAISSVGDTAKTLYAVLAPLATAVTGYYFTITPDGSDSKQGE